MSKNLSFENSINEKSSEEFLAFLKDYNNLQGTQSNAEFATGTISFSSGILFLCELLSYYQIEESILRKMVMLGILFMFVAFLGKTILEVSNNVLHRKQRKKDIAYMDQKAQGWIEFLKEKENKLNIARGLITRLENLEKIKFEKINKENIDKSIQSKKEDVYNFVKYEVSKNDFDSLESLFITIQNIENNTMDLFTHEQELKQIKNEINVGVTSNTSNSFKNNAVNKSFN